MMFAFDFNLQVAQQLEEVDGVLSELMQGLYVSDMMHCVNIIIIADHGQYSSSALLLSSCCRTYQTAVSLLSLSLSSSSAADDYRH